MSTILRKSFLGVAVATLAAGASLASASAFAASRMSADDASPYAYESYYADPNGAPGRSAYPTLPTGTYSDGIHYDAQGKCHGWKCDF